MSNDKDLSAKFALLHPRTAQAHGIARRGTGWGGAVEPLRTGCAVVIGDFNTQPGDPARTCGDCLQGRAALEG